MLIGVVGTFAVSLLVAGIATQPLRALLGAKGGQIATLILAVLMIVVCFGAVSRLTARISFHGLDFDTAKGYVQRLRRPGARQPLPKKEE
jgi:hypothetical protein